jgi:hypothetical protein
MPPRIHHTSVRHSSAGGDTHLKSAAHSSAELSRRCVPPLPPPVTTWSPSARVTVPASASSNVMVRLPGFHIVRSAGQTTNTSSPSRWRKTQSSVIRNLPPPRASIWPSWGGWTARGPHSSSPPALPAPLPHPETMTLAMTRTATNLILCTFRISWDARRAWTPQGSGRCHRTARLALGCVDAASAPSRPGAARPPAGAESAHVMSPGIARFVVPAAGRPSPRGDRSRNAPAAPAGPDGGRSWSRGKLNGSSL